MMFMSGESIAGPFHKVLSFNIVSTDTVDHDMHMNIACRVVTIRMRTDKSFVSREIFFCKFHPESLCLLGCKSIVITIPRIKADDVMMGFDFSPGLILIEAFVGLFTFFSEGIRITVNPFQNEV